MTSWHGNTFRITVDAPSIFHTLSLFAAWINRITTCNLSISSLSVGRYVIPLDWCKSVVWWMSHVRMISTLATAVGGGGFLCNSVVADLQPPHSTPWNIIARIYSRVASLQNNIYTPVPCVTRTVVSFSCHDRLTVLSSVYYHSTDDSPFWWMGHGRIISTLTTAVDGERCISDSRVTDWNLCTTP